MWKPSMLMHNNGSYSSTMSSILFRGCWGKNPVCVADEQTHPLSTELSLKMSEEGIYMLLHIRGTSSIFSSL